MIHVRFLNGAPDDASAARLGRLLTGTENEADRLAMLPAKLPDGSRDPRTMPGWRPGFKPIGSGGGRAVTAGAPA